jgi:Protein of unknown function (DUF2961)
MRTAAAVLIVAAAFSPHGFAGAADHPPWEFWDSAAELPRLVAGDQVLLYSSRCPSGCAFDRSSEGDTRFLRIDGDEDVLFEEFGPGAITRIWMTAGEGVSEPLSSHVRLRVRLDGEAAPRIDLSLGELFAGTRPPFTPPLVQDRTSSSGGNVSYVPIPYQHGCRVSLVGAETYKLWFQFTLHRLAFGTEVKTFTNDGDLSRWRELLEAPGADPWATAGGAPLTGRLDLASGAKRAIASFQGPGLVTRLLLDVPSSARGSTFLILTFDGVRTAALPVSDFFAAGGEGPTPTRSLLVGLDADGWLYSYFPMPFFGSASIELQSFTSANEPAVAVRYEVRKASIPPAADSGLFGAQRTQLWPTAPPGDAPLLSLPGRGKWVGVFAELRNFGATGRSYLEGDERVYVDGARHPALYGTGVEDFYGGGFYFDRGPFALPLHGSPYHDTSPAGEDVTAAYRLLLTDAVPFASGIQAGVENGPTGITLMRTKTVAYFYAAPGPALRPIEAFDVADAASASAHGWTVGDAVCRAVTSAFESEPVSAETFLVCSRAGAAEFRFRAAGSGAHFRLRRRFDAALAGQAAEVWVNGRLAGRFPSTNPNPARRFREADLDLDVPAGAPALQFRIVPTPGSGELAEDTRLTEIRWELWAGPPLVADAAEGIPRKH